MFFTSLPTLWADGSASINYCHPTEDMPWDLCDHGHFLLHWLLPEGIDLTLGSLPASPAGWNSSLPRMHQDPT